MKLNERIAWIRRHGPADPPLRHVLEVMASYDDDTGREVWPAVETIASATAYHPRSIRRTLGKLARLGWIVPMKPARETRPYGAGGREAMWVHGNTGGRTNSTRWRVIYRSESTLTSCPSKPGHRVRVSKSCPSETLTSCPETLTTCPLNPDTLSGDPVVIRNDPRGGDTPPSPPSAVRHALQSELRKAGADISTTANVEAWESILATIGVEEAREVPRVVYDLAMEFERVSGAKLPRPYLAALVSNGSAAAAAKLAARRELDHRTHQRKESA